ncbi:MAG: hypothetical protein U9R72_04345 [Chloroflexota bacterium]|nr:hypothetical protein [Chloroflexota bacterium]
MKWKGSPGVTHPQANRRHYTCAELKWLLTGVGFESIAFFAVPEGGCSRNRSLSRNHFEIGTLATKPHHTS